MSTAWNKILNSFVIAAFLALAPANATAQAVGPAVAPMKAMVDFVGSWTCEGVVPTRGQKITSTINFAPDLGGTSLLIHHDDTSIPALYHAIELWGYNVGDKTFHAAIQDSFGGIREFTSPGLIGNSLLWTSASTVTPPQQFEYNKQSSDKFMVTWRVSRNGTDYLVGDSLACLRIAK